MDPPRYAPGDMVEYWSHTHAQWMDAKVQQVNRVANRLTYSLDIKTNAKPERIRARVRDPAGDPAPETHLVSRVHSGARIPDTEFCQGDLVQYWSETHTCWMDATVEGYNAKHDTGLVLHLDIKKNACLTRIRRPLEISVPGRAPSTRPTTTLARDPGPYTATGVTTESRLPTKLSNVHTVVEHRGNRTEQSIYSRSTRASSDRPSTDSGDVFARVGETDAQGWTARSTATGRVSEKTTVMHVPTPGREGSQSPSRREAPVVSHVIRREAPSEIPYFIRETPGEIRHVIRTTGEISHIIGPKVPDEIYAVRREAPDEISHVVKREVLSQVSHMTRAPSDILHVRRDAGEILHVRREVPSEFPHVRREVPSDILHVRREAGEILHVRREVPSEFPHVIGYDATGDIPCIRRDTVTSEQSRTSSLDMRSCIRRDTVTSERSRTSPMSCVTVPIEVPEVNLGRRVITSVTDTTKSYSEIPDGIYTNSNISCMPWAHKIEACERPIQVAQCHVKAPCSKFSVEECTVENFDPHSPQCTEQLQQILRMNGEISALKGFQGGLNEGVWRILNSVGSEEILKLVKAVRLCDGVPTEAENICCLAARFPNLLKDEDVCFPFKVVHIINSAQNYDLFVMRKSSGTRLAEVLSTVWRQDHAEVYALLLRFGKFLAAFHQRYGNAQHVDVQPSNIFYDNATKRFTLIDAGGMGMNCAGSDVEHFNKSLSILANSYGKDLAEIGSTFFNKGYLGR